MEKQTTKSINKIFKLLPKVSQAASVSFQNPHYSPGKDHPHNKRFNNSHFNKGFSGTIIPFIPIEARSKSKNDDESSADQEPTSPKISCMGQIKHKHTMCKSKQQHKMLTKSVSYLNPRQKIITRNDKSIDTKKAKKNGISKMFGSSARKSEASAKDCKPPLPDRAPSLSQMRRFASSRDAFASFDWTTARISVEENCRDHDFSDDDDDEVIIPFSAPIIAVKPVSYGCDQVGSFEPKKEINLWKRRTMAQPEPLQMDMVRLRSRN